MQVNKGVQVVNRLPELALSNKPKLIISKEIQSQITYLHSRIGAIEWSGELLYSIQQGSILDLDNFVIKAEGIFPLDKGNATYTEHETTVDICDLMDMYPAYGDDLLKRGYIHTHHNMSTFFSGTDMAELHDNSPKHNYYLSLIVDFTSKYCAKIAIVAENKKEVVQSQELIFKGDDAQPVSMPLVTPESKKDNKCLVLIDCIIEFEQNEDFIKKVDEIIAKAAAKPVAPVKSTVPAKTYPNILDSRKDKVSKTNNYSNKYAVDAEDLGDLGLDWDNYPNTDVIEGEPFKEDVEWFLRDILSTPEILLTSEPLVKESLKSGLTKINASLNSMIQMEDYMDSVAEDFEKYWDVYLDAREFTLKAVACAAGDLIDDLYPTPVKGTFGYELSETIWGIYNSK